MIFLVFGWVFLYLRRVWRIWLRVESFGLIFLVLSLVM